MRNRGRVTDENRVKASDLSERFRALELEGDATSPIYTTATAAMTRGPPVGISAVILRNGKNSLKAVRKAVTNASFCAPEISNVANKVVSWIEEFAEKAASEVVLLSGHYYAEWPPEDPRMTIGRLLERDPRLPTNTPRSMR